MKYAIISDIHGNLPAFRAALADAEAHGAGVYLLLGDYTTCFPWGNEVVEAIRKLTSAVVIRGNGEDYFIGYADHKLDLDNEQFKPAYWDYRSLSRENLAYLMALPARAEVPGEEIYLSHALNIMHHTLSAACFRARDFRAMMEQSPISHREYLALAQETLLSCHEALADILAFPKGVHLFGHNHMQFHMEHEGRLFVNPGSCGQALNFDTRAAYTLLTREGDRWSVQERRVEYDLNEVATGLETSGFSAYAPVWSKIFLRELTTGKCYMTPFVTHLMDTGRAMGQSESPVSQEVWRAAVQTWDADQI